MKWSKFDKKGARTFCAHPCLRIGLSSFLLLLLLPTHLPAAENAGVVAKKVGVEEHLGSRLNLELEFTNRSGKRVRLGDLLVENRPVLLTPVYYQCPSLCPLVFTGVAQLINEMKLQFGKDYQVISLTMNPEENAEHAQATAKRNYEQLSEENRVSDAWHFLTGSKENIQAVMDQIGFIYRPDGTEFMHAAVLVTISPQGVISRYFYGVTFSSKDVRLALVEASAGKIGRTLDRVFLYCFRFDPTKGKYTPIVMNIMRISCGTVFLALASTLVWLRAGENEREENA